MWVAIWRLIMPVYRLSVEISGLRMTVDRMLIAAQRRAGVLEHWAEFAVEIDGQNAPERKNYIMERLVVPWR